MADNWTLVPEKAPPSSQWTLTPEESQKPGFFSGANEVVGEVGTAAYKGISDVVGLPNTVLQLLQHFQTTEPKYIFTPNGLQPNPKAGQQLPPEQTNLASPQAAQAAINVLPSVQGTRGFMQNTLGIPFRDPNIIGKYPALAVEGGTAGLLMPGAAPAGAMFTSGATGAVGSEAAGELTKGTKYEIPARIAGGVVGGLAGQGLYNVLDRSVGALTGRLTPQAQAYADVGVQPRLASQVSESPSVRFWQNTVGDMPGGFDRIRNAAQQTTDDIAAAAERQAAALGTATPGQEAGQALQQGTAMWYPQFRAQETAAWNNFRNAMPAGTRVPLQNTTRVLADITQAMPDAPAIANQLRGAGMDNLLTSVLQDTAQDGSISLQSLLRFRSEIGSRISDPSLLSDIPLGELRRIYGALTQDIRDVAPPQALDAFNAANAVTTAGHQFSEHVANNILQRAGGVTPEQAASWALSQGRQGATRLGQLRANLPQPEWENYVSGVIRGLGQQRPGADWSPSVFATNFERLPALTRNVLFTGTSYADLERNMGALSQIAGDMRDVSRLANNSRTAGTSLIMNMLGGGGGSAAGFAAGGPSGAAIGAMTGVAAPYLSASVLSRLFTNPLFIRWLSTPTTLDGLPAALRRLSAISAAYPAIAPDLNAFAGAVNQSATQAAGQKTQQAP